MDDDEVKEELYEKANIKIVGISLDDFRNMTMDEVVDKLTKHLDEVFDKTHPPESYWHAFAKHYGFDHLSDQAQGYAAFSFFNGMRSMLDIVRGILRIKNHEVHNLGCGFMNALINDLIRKYDPGFLTKPKPKKPD